MYGRERSLRGWIDDLRFDVVGAIVGLLLAALLFPLRFLSSQIYIQTLPIVLGVACVLYLLAARHDRSERGIPELGGWFARFAPAVVCFGLAGMVLSAAASGQRTLHFYDLGGIVGAVLLAQILFLRERDFHPGVVLAQVVALGVVVRFAALYTAPGFIGVDVWSHTTYVDAILQQGSLAAISESKYFASPLYHLLTVAAADLYGVSIRNAIYLSLGIALPLSVLLVYEATALLVPPRWATFAAASYVLSDHAIRWGIHIIPTSMGLVFFLAMVVHLTRVFQNDHRLRDYAMLVFFSAAVILTHQISSFIMLVLVATGLVGQILLYFDLFDQPNTGQPFLQGSAEPANLVGLLVFDVGLITFMWSLTPYQGDTFLETVLSYLYETLVTSAGFLNGVSSDSSSAAAAGSSPTSQFIAELATYVDTLGFLLLLFTTVVGSLVVLRRRRANHATFTHLFAVVVMLFFVLGLPLFNIDNFVPGRWVAFLYVPMVVLTAIGLRYLSRNLSPTLLVATLLVFLLLFPSVMLMADAGTPDSPVFSSQNERLSYTDTELTAVRTIDEVTEPGGQPLYTDHPYATVFVRTDTHPAEVLRVRNGRVVRDGPIVYREYQSDGGSFFRTEAGAGIRDVPRQRVCPSSTNHVYANGDVRMCRSPSTGG
jgi:uncharacterized membrane protein